MCLIGIKAKVFLDICIFLKVRRNDIGYNIYLGIINMIKSIRMKEIN